MAYPAMLPRISMPSLRKSLLVITAIALFAGTVASEKHAASVAQMSVAEIEEKLQVC
jgi:hypothetical protein